MVVPRNEEESLVHTMSCQMHSISCGSILRFFSHLAEVWKHSISYLLERVIYLWPRPHSMTPAGVTPYHHAQVLGIFLGLQPQLLVSVAQLGIHDVSPDNLDFSIGVHFFQISNGLGRFVRVDAASVERDGRLRIQL